MDDKKEKKNDFMEYEYKELIAESSKVSFLIDGYECFGWELDEELSGSSKEDNLPNQKKKVIRLKRNRKLVNKMELTRLQRNFEACVNEIAALENSKTSVATMVAISMGIIGTAFMAGSVFAIAVQPPHIVLSILLAVPAFLGWIFPNLLYKKIVSKQTKKLTPLIEEKYDELYELFEKGNKLLY